MISADNPMLTNAFCAAVIKFDRMTSIRVQASVSHDIDHVVVFCVSSQDVENNLVILNVVKSTF